MSNLYLPLPTAHIKEYLFRQDWTTVRVQHLINSHALVTPSRQRSRDQGTVHRCSRPSSRGHQVRDHDVNLTLNSASKRYQVAGAVQ